MSDIRKRVGKKGTTYQVRYPSKNTRSGYAYKTFDSLKEARAFREDSKARASSAPLSREIRTIDQALRKWLDVCEKEGRNGRDPVTLYTLKSYEYRAEIIRSYNWQRELHELSAPDVVEFRSWLLRNYSRDQARKALSSFHSMVLEMVGRGLMAHDIAAGVTINSNSRYDEPATIPTVEDITALLMAADRLANSKNRRIQQTWERYRPMLYLAADSGMRPQEYIVVPTFNVFDCGVKVDRALERGGYKISVTKTRAGRRFIDLSPETYAMIRHYADRHAAPSDYDLVFPTSSGKWQSTDNWRKRGFYAACFEAGLVKKVLEDGQFVEKPKYKPYDLRHFYASALIERRYNLKRIQSLMGHEDIQTTLNVYGHLIEKAENAGEERTGLLAHLGT
ncbi:MAG TPA: site-specific integrase [Anaerolineae bacterium]|jgi:integrase|nr:site-specific integrase [Anaerolineae bacterium]